jgi:hypothetical protein
MVPRVNVVDAHNLCLTPRDPIEFDLVTYLANMTMAWQVKPLEINLDAFSISIHMHG